MLPDLLSLIGFAALILLICVPGIAALRLLLVGKTHPFFFVFLGSALGVAIVGLLGVLLATIGQFKLSWLLVGTGIVSAVLILFSKRRTGVRWHFDRLSGWDKAVLPLFLIMLFVFARPHENVVVGRDPGVYTNTAIHLARSGRWAIDDPFFATLSPSTQDAFLSYVWEQGPFRLPGFFWEPEKARAVSQFLPFFTVWMAIIELFMGPGGGRWAPLLFTMISALGLAHLVGRFWKRRTAFFFLLLFLCNPAVIWYSRSANSEVALLMLLIGLVYLWIVGQEKPENRVISLFISLILTAALLDKLDMFYLFVVFVVFLWMAGLCSSRSASRYLWYGIAALIAFVLAAVFMWQFSLPYLRLSFNLRPVTPLIKWGLLAVFVLLFAITLSYRFNKTIRGFLEKCQDWVEHFPGLTRQQMWVLGFLLLGIYIGLYFLFPALVPTGIFNDKRLSFVKLGLYTTPLGILLAGAGLVDLYRRHPPRGAVLFSGIMWISLGINLWIYMPDHIFAIRRFMLFALPGLLALSAGGLEWLVSWRFSYAPRLGAWIALFLGSTLLYGQIAKSRILLLHREFEGARVGLQTVANMLPLDSVVVFPEPDSLLGTFMGPYFWFAYDQNPLYAAEPLDLEDWRSIQVAAQRYPADLYAITSEPPPDWEGVDRMALQRFTWHLPELERTYEHYPSRIDSFNFEFVVWELRPGLGRTHFVADVLPTEVGRLTQVGDQSLLLGSEQVGYLSYGPYQYFSPGLYTAEFRLVNLQPEAQPVVLDAIPVELPPLAELSLDLEPTQTPYPVTLDFRVTDEVATRPLEFRVFLPNGGQVGLATLEITPRHKKN